MASAGDSFGAGRHVLVIVENLSVPFDRRVWQECKVLVESGFDVSVICPMGSKRDVEPHVTIDGVEIHRYPLEAATGGASGYVREYGLAFWRTWRLARKIHAQNPVDIVHACNPPDLLLLTSLFARRRGACQIFDHHDLVPELFESRFGGRGALYQLTRFLERVNFGLADVVISTNESYRNVAIERGKLAPERVHVVRSAPDVTRFQGVEPDPSLRNGRSHLLAYLGVMGPQDGVDQGLLAIAELMKQRDDVYTVLVGGGDVLEEMKQLASDLGLDDHVRFTGRVSDEELATVLSTADVCLAPDPMNPLNDVSTMNKIVEYMALGKPLVSFDLREARVSAGDAAIYAPAGDIDAFAAGIAQLLDDPDDRERRGSLGRDRVHAELSWAHSAENLRTAYRQAVSLLP